MKFGGGDPAALPDEIPPPPPVDVPDEGQTLWGWYWTLSARVRRVRDGVCEPILASEFLAWCQASGTIIYAHEYDILCAMDVAFCDEMQKEITDYRIRQQEQQRMDMSNTSWVKKRR